VAASTEDHPDHAGRADCLSNLGIALQALFERTGELEALAEAVDLARAAVDATPEDHPDRAMYLGNLGNALQTLFERTERQDVLAEAVTVGLQAVEATPANHPDRAGRLNSLGNVLRTLFEHTGQQGVLFESVDALRAAVAGTPEDHPDRASRLSNLGGTLRVLFGHTGQQEALIEAVAVGRQAVDAASEDHPSCAMYLTNLGHALQTLFAHTGQRDALAEARHTYRDAASSTQGSMIARITAYRQLALLAQLAGDVQDGLRCAEAAIDLVEVLAPGSLARADREHQLGRLANLAGEAAAAALNAGQPTRAVELLERTRGILASDTLGLRGDDLTRLHADQTHGHLADQVEQLRSCPASSGHAVCWAARRVISRIAAQRTMASWVSSKRS
jgi:tetratricopeptide (TPR) repeat protein